MTAFKCSSVQQLYDGCSISGKDDPDEIQLTVNVATNFDLVTCSMGGEWDEAVRILYFIDTMST